MRDTIDMAREAQISDTTIEFYKQELKAFEALVRAGEREACAKVADDYFGFNAIADAIRARGETK